MANAKIGGQRIGRGEFCLTGSPQTQSDAAKRARCEAKLASWNVFVSGLQGWTGESFERLVMAWQFQML